LRDANDDCLSCTLETFQNRHMCEQNINENARVNSASCDDESEIGKKILSRRKSDAATNFAERLLGVAIVSAAAKLFAKHYIAKIDVRP
jgi:hypothetical protein